MTNSSKRERKKPKMLFKTIAKIKIKDLVSLMDPSQPINFLSSTNKKIQKQSNNQKYK